LATAAAAAAGAAEASSVLNKCVLALTQLPLFNQLAALIAQQHSI
jgi:hypothetical protein